MSQAQSATVIKSAQSAEPEKCTGTQKLSSAGPLLRLPSVMAQTGLSKTEIYRRIKEGKFKKPLKLGVRARAWRQADIDAWIASLEQVSQ